MIKSHQPKKEKEVYEEVQNSIEQRKKSNR